MTSEDQQSLVTGALVEWGSRNAVGVITENDGRRIHVRWDDPGPPTQFSAEDPPLSRVHFTGTPVLRKSSEQYVVPMTSVAGAATPTWSWQVLAQTGSPSIVNIPEADLRLVPITNPVGKFRHGEIGSTKRYLLRQVTQLYRIQNL